MKIESESQEEGDTGGEGGGSEEESSYEWTDCSEEEEEDLEQETYSCILINKCSNRTLISSPHF